MGKQGENLDFWNFQLECIHGKSGGKILWQPRIECWYDDKIFLGQELPGAFRGKNLPEIYRELGCSNRIYEYNSCFQAVDAPDIHREERRLSDLETEYIIHTPVGTISSVFQENTSNPGRYPKKWWVENTKDLKVMGYILKHQKWIWREDIYQELQKKWGRLGAPTIYMPRVNVQYLYLDLMGVENGIFLLMDEKEEAESFFQILEENQERMIKVINQSPIEMINFGDNLHCKTLPPYHFEEYVLPAYQKRCRLLHEGGKFVYAHWDGDTKDLLPYARQTGLDGIEAITPLPQGDVTLEEVKEALGDDVWLIDGVAAIFFDREFPVEELVRQVETCIRLFAPKLILGISDELSSTGDIERVRLVGKMVEKYNQLFQ